MQQGVIDIFIKRVYNRYRNVNLRRRLMKSRIFELNGVRIVIDSERGCLAEIGYTQKGIYRPMLTSDKEFTASPVSCGGEVSIEEKSMTAVFRAETEYYFAESVVSLSDKGVRRRQIYTIRKEFSGSVNPNFVCADRAAKYTYSLRVYDKPILEVPSLRNDYLWALPLPAHLWHGEEYAAVYCLDRQNGVGTCDFVVNDGQPQLGVFYPDRTGQEEAIAPFSDTRRPESCVFRPGDKVEFTEYIAFAPLAEGEHPILKSEKLAAGLLSDYTLPEIDYTERAEGIAHYYENNGLWNPDALGEGKGWYRNMWKRTNGGISEKDFYYDLGWGEGYGVITLSALVRYSVRTGSERFRTQIEQITENIRMFLREESVSGMYYDRFIPKGMPTLLGKYNDYEKCDFLGIRRIWTHSLAMIGYQLATLYEEVKGYRADLRNVWLKTAREIGDFLVGRQKPNGDINDGFDDEDKECNKKRHRIPARAIACGLFAKLYTITQRIEYRDAAVRLAVAVSPEIEKYEFYNQMLDAHVDVVNGEIVASGHDEDSEIYDGENACYAFAGLVDALEIVGDESLLKLCENCAAYFITWMYFYDIKTGVNGRARGATTCRMPDFPLVYIGAGNFAYSALIKFSRLTKDDFYENIAKEMLRCAVDYQLSAPDKPWDKGIVHAIYQVNGKHWGPDIQGQMDTGMTSGSTLMNVEKYLTEIKKQ